MERWEKDEKDERKGPLASGCKLIQLQEFWGEL